MIHMLLKYWRKSSEERIEAFLWPEIPSVEVGLKSKENKQLENVFPK